MQYRSQIGLFVVLALGTFSLAAERPWQKISNPSAAEVAQKFNKPPSESCNTVTWGWNGPMTEEVIARDLETLHARGLRIATIEAGYRMDNAPYLTEEWFKLIRFAATEAKKRDMRLIIIDEGKYPSGFVNGKYTLERPDLRMKAIGQPQRIMVPAGQAFQRDLPPEAISAIAFNGDNGTAIPLDISSGKINWTAPAGRWEVIIGTWRYATPQTRAVRTPDGAKTTDNSMGDLIDPEASRLFIEWTHEQYKKHVGDLFGDVIIAFRGDEPEMTGIPWTPKIAEEFKKRKGYDVRDYMAAFTFPNNQITDQQRRAKADYYDVWGELFAKYFFDAQADWCAANGIEATTHLNNDHQMPALVRTTADFYRAMRKYQIPGVDVIWNQVWPGKVAEFVRFPSSAAHVNGRPRALSESFAAFTPPAAIEEARFGVNYQLVRGINMFEFMFFMSSAGRGNGRGDAAAAAPATAPTTARARGYMTDQQFPQLAAYTNRMTYVLAQGRPAAQVAVYMPTMGIWMGESAGNTAMLAVAQALSDTQRDFDFVDDEAVARSMKLTGDTFVNASQQSYRAVIVPAAGAISKAALDRLQAFAKAGGKVIFLGAAPSLVVDKNFLDAKPPTDLSWAVLEPTGEVSEKVLAALPKSDVVFDQPNLAVKVMHRTWRDSEVYFFFNESDQKQTCNASVIGRGSPQLWDAYNAKISPIAGTASSNGSTKFPLEFEPYGAKLIVIGPNAQ